MKRATLITGASKGIGLACASLLAERGHNVVGLARNATDSRFPGELHLVDLADRHALAAALVALTDRYQFNGLVNNVGYVTPQTLEVVDLAAYDLTFEVNATSAMLCAQALLPGMQALGGETHVLGTRGSEERNNRAEQGSGAQDRGGLRPREHPAARLYLPGIREYSADQVN
jgi:short-subunit dehydrogenase